MKNDHRIKNLQVKIKYLSWKKHIEPKHENNDSLINKQKVNELFVNGIKVVQLNLMVEMYRVKKQMHLEC